MHVEGPKRVAERGPPDGFQREAAEVFGHLDLGAFLRDLTVQRVYELAKVSASTGLLVRCEITHVLRDLVEHCYHVSEIAHREDRAQMFALLRVLLSCNRDVMRTRLNLKWV